MLEQFMEDCLPWVGPYTGAWEDHEEEGVAETTCSELTTTLFLHPPVMLKDQAGKSGVKLSIGRGGQEGKCLKIVLISHYLSVFSSLSLFPPYSNC